MKKLKYILVPLITLAIFLAPFSPIFEKNKKNFTLDVKKNSALAGPTLQDCFGGSSITMGPKNSNSAEFTLDIVLTESNPECTKTTDNIVGGYIDSYNSMLKNYGIPLDQAIVVVLKDTKTNSPKTLNIALAGFFDRSKTNNSRKTTTGSILKPETEYSLQVYVVSNNTTSQNSYGGYEYWASSPVKFTTTAKNDADPTDVNTGAGTSSSEGSGTIQQDFGCSAWPTSWFTNCLAATFYYIIFVPVSAFAWLSAKFLDFFVYYSTNSSSYAGDFVSKAWSAIRDVANIFFIVALLYVAIKTILGLNVSDNKKLISAVIIVALLINFSLFFTQVIIDGSNILAKVFYNNIVSKGENGKVLPAGAGGEKSISVSLVSTFDPQNIFTASGTQIKNNVGKFVFITVLSILLMCYMIYIFLSIALLFVGRVVALWISMIFSPIAFASYTVPFEIPGFGHKEWWPELLKNAFLAPVFIFFLYIIAMFGNLFKTIVYSSGDGSWLDSFMHTIIPFALVIILLMKAKELAVKFSGEIGKSMSKVGAVAGGLALGAATGGAAMLGRATLGRAGSVLGDSEWVKKWQSTEGGGLKGMLKRKIGTVAQDTGKAAGKGSFDLRGAKIAGQSLASTGLKSLGKPKEGGFEKRREDMIAKRQKRADGLKAGEYSESKQALKRTEMDLHDLNAAVAKDIASIDEDIEHKQAEIVDINNRLRAAKTDQERRDVQDELAAANSFVSERKNAKKDLRDGKAYQITERDEYGNVTIDPKTGKEKMINKTGKSAGTMKGPNGEIVQIGIRQLEKLKNKQTFDIEHENHARTSAYAKIQSSAESQALDFITSMGQHSFRGAQEAEYKIRTGAKVPTLEKGSHDGGGHAPVKHNAPHPPAPKTPPKSNKGKKGGKEPGPDPHHPS